MSTSDRDAHIANLKAYGAKVQGDMITLFRGADVSMEEIKKIRYGDYLLASEGGDDASGNAGAASYGKNVVRFCCSVDDVIVTGAGEYQYKGKSASLTEGALYPIAIYRAYNDAYASNYTAREIDAQDNVRAVASQALSGGRDEFDVLLAQHRGAAQATEAEPMSVAERDRG